MKLGAGRGRGATKSARSSSASRPLAGQVVAAIEALT
jgi:hypothetical protein